ncbi:LacI family DNA-binding transcriptional regulator [Deinococcus geothermalis]|uniref:Transcriptional regulator, LacI family n=1 Tax=Deinococcus geothermalis (strain DSM 11300 / CIP 105573 / AG-3a) TaxID=319795 RepID=Q1J304_DEIGD|nr:LacI family DNA-binding transcriptional regulator [Deinococcus geothermalis]ABF44130.1 transcriptional regulator, LacI family [Deinococcus geothermalis DSM 11300]
MRSNPVTLADIASQAGVSKMTVSKVVNKQPGISEATRQRVLRIIEELGYTAHPSARALAGGRTNTLGIVVPSIGPQYISEVVRGADLVAYEAGLDLLISTTQEDTSHERQNVGRLSRGLVDGLLMVLPRSLDRYADALKQAEVPVVVVASANTTMPFPLVDADHYHGARLAVAHLLGLGHRRVGFIAGRRDTTASLERLRGYREGLLTAGLTPDPVLIRPGEYTQPGGFAAARSLLDLPDPPTAIFAANDLSAFGAMEAIKDRGLRVPDDVSVVGFDDIPQANQVHPALTTVRQPLVEMGTAGTRQLLNLLHGVGPVTDRLVLPTELIVRASTGPAPRT